MANRTEIQKHLEERMREIKTQIEQLNGKIEQSGEEARAELERSIDDLQARNAKAEEQLRELGKAGDDVLKTMASDIETYWNAFAGAIDNVFVESKPASNTPSTTVKIDVEDASEMHEGPDSPTS
ncbi:MAG: hypothetical protein AAF787_18485 [Chloroflexota bacterium]